MDLKNVTRLMLSMNKLYMMGLHSGGPSVHWSLPLGRGHEKWFVSSMQLRVYCAHHCSGGTRPVNL